MQDLRPEEQKEYSDFIKASVANGSYFKDARDWYIFRYVYPICERTILLFTIAIAGFISYIEVITIINALPLKQEVPVIIRPKDQSKYFTVIKKLNDSVELKNVDEAVLKYILVGYVKKREGYNFRQINLEALNKQMDYVKNNSSIQEYTNFQIFLSRDNQNSPINYFGKDFQRLVDIESVVFVKPEIRNLLDRAREFVKVEELNEANIKYKITTKINSKVVSSEKLLVKIKFKFSGVNASKSSNSKLDFIVTGYKIYKVK